MKLCSELRDFINQILFGKRKIPTSTEVLIRNPIDPPENYGFIWNNSILKTMEIEEVVFLFHAIGKNDEQCENEEIKELMEIGKEQLYDDVYEENDYRSILMSFLNVFPES